MSLTPRELLALIEGYNWRLRKQRELAAWQIHHITASIVGCDNAPSMDDLMGPE